MVDEESSPGVTVLGSAGLTVDDSGIGTVQHPFFQTKPRPRNDFQHSLHWRHLQLQRLG